MGSLLALILAVGLPAPDGGGRVAVSTGVSRGDWYLLPDCQADGGNALNYTSSTNAFTCGGVLKTEPGGSSPQVQFNNSSSFGGMSQVESSSGHISLVPEAVAPSPITDRALITAFIIDGGWPIMPMIADPANNHQMPVGWLAGGTLSPAIGSQEVWIADCHYPDSFGGSTYADPAHRANGMVATGSPSGLQFDAGTWWAQQRWDPQANPNSNANQACGARMQSKTSIRGAAAHSGGFVFWARVALRAVTTPVRAFFGLEPTASSSAWGAKEASNFINSVYFGVDPRAAANLEICSNDSTGSATCSDLGNNFPLTSNSTYDLWLYAPPNGSYINYFIQRLPDTDDTAHASSHAAGRITSDLPGNQELMAMRLELNNADAGAAAAVSIGPSCTWDNW